MLAGTSTETCKGLAGRGKGDGRGWGRERGVRERERENWHVHRRNSKMNGSER